MSNPAPLVLPPEPKGEEMVRTTILVDRATYDWITGLAFASDRPWSYAHRWVLRSARQEALGANGATAAPAARAS